MIPAPAPRARPQPAAARRRVRLVAVSVAGTLGVVLIIAGTFLPWLDSGGRGRNIYELVGVAGKLGFLDAGLARSIPATVGLIGPLCIVPLVLGVLRLRRSAAGAAIACGLLAGLPGVAALVLGDRADAAGIELNRAGPVVLLLGGLLLAAAGIAALTRLPSARTVPATPVIAARQTWPAGLAHSAGAANGGGTAPPSVTLDGAAGNAGVSPTDQLRHTGRDVQRRGEL